jgi:hypothetical protein
MISPFLCRKLAARSFRQAAGISKPCGSRRFFYSYTCSALDLSVFVTAVELKVLDALLGRVVYISQEQAYMAGIGLIDISGKAASFF